MKRFKPVFPVLILTLLLAGCGDFSEENKDSVSSSENSLSSLSITSWNIYQGNGLPSHILSYLNEETTDLICLQECTADPFMEVVQPFLEQNPSYAIMNHDESEKLATPIIYNTEKIELIESDYEILNDCYNETKMMAYAVLKEKETEQSFVQVNFHGAVCISKYAPYKDYSDEELFQQANNWRIGNVRQILDKVSSLTTEYGELPVLISGDCNFKEDSEPYQNLMEAGYSDAQKVARVKDPATMCSSHTYGTPCKEGLPIDHVFGNSKVNFTYQHFTRDEITELASDHYPNKVEFQFK